MSRAAKPWVDTIPEEDLASFGRAFDSEERPLSAGTRPAVVVVDMTRAFVDSTYATAWSPTGKPAVEANARLLQGARAAGLPVFFTHGYPQQDAQVPDVLRGRWKSNATPPPLPPGTPPGDVVVPELGPLPGEILIDKGVRPSAFFGTPLVT